MSLFPIIFWALPIASLPQAGRAPKNSGVSYGSVDRKELPKLMGGIYQIWVILNRNPENVLPGKLTMSPENQWVEDLFPIEIGPFLRACSFSGVY